MAYQSLGIGSAADDGTGDSLRVGGDKINDNFSEIYTLLGTGTALVSGISAGADDLTFVGDSYNALWDKSASSFHFLDSAKAVFGTGSDLSLYHDSNNSALTHNGTGDFYIQSDQFYFRSNTGGEIYATATLNGVVTLYYDNSAKVATTSAGISITGTVATTGNIELGTSATLIFEGSTANAHETILTVTDPTADRTITLPNATGTVITSGDSGSVTSEMIADGTIVSGDIANGTIATVDLSDNSVTSAKIVDGTIVSGDIADGTITGTDIAADTVAEANMADDAIGSVQLKSLQSLLIKNSSGSTLRTLHCAGA